jgi:hypothetical protein
MNRTAKALAPLALLLAGGGVSAQDAPSGHCPQLPAAAGLAWESSAMGEGDFCRAVRSDGSEAFGLFITPDPSFEPNARNAEEGGRVDGRAVTWYRAEIATAPGIEARETLVPMRDGRHAHIWLQAASATELAATYATIGQLGFTQAPQVAGN